MRTGLGSDHTSSKDTDADSKLAGELVRLARKYYLGGLRVEIANLARQRLRQRYYAQSEPAVIEVRPQSAALLSNPGAAPDYADTTEPLMSLGRFP